METINRLPVHEKIYLETEKEEQIIKENTFPHPGEFDPYILPLKTFDKDLTMGKFRTFRY